MTEYSIPQSRSPIRKIADALAIVLHPLFLSFYGLMILLAGKIYGGQMAALTMLGTAFALTVAIPLAATLWIGKDVYLKKRSSRPIPLLITLAGYIGLIFISKYYFPHIYTQIKFYEHIVALNVGLMLLVTLWYKISVHANGFGVWVAVLAFWALMATALGGITHSFGMVALGVSLPFALVLWQRRVSGSHTWMQIILGFLSGLILTACYFGFLAEIL